MIADGLVDLEDVGLVDLGFHRVLVYADDSLLLAFDGLLIEIRRLLDLALREACLNRFDHSAKAVDLVEVIHTTFDHLFGKRFDIPRTAQRIDGVCHTGLFSDDLLGAKSDKRGVVAWECKSLVEGIGVKRLCSAEHTSESLYRDACDVVKGLLNRKRN